MGRQSARLGGMAHQHVALELVEGARFDLPHALLRDAKLHAEGFERLGVFLQLTRAQDAQLALVKRRKRLVQPLQPPLAVDPRADDLIRQRPLVHQEIAESRAFMPSTSASETPSARAIC